MVVPLYYNKQYYYYQYSIMDDMIRQMSRILVALWKQKFSNHLEYQQNMLNTLD